MESQLLPPPRFISALPLTESTCPPWLLVARVGVIEISCAVKGESMARVAGRNRVVLDLVMVLHDLRPLHVGKKRANTQQDGGEVD